MTNSASQGNQAAVEIAKLEGQMKTGFANLGGKLDTLIAKQEAADEARALDQVRTEKELDALKTRVTTVEARKTVSPMGLLVATGSGIAAAVGLFQLIDYIN